MRKIILIIVALFSVIGLLGCSPDEGFSGETVEITFKAQFLVGKNKKGDDTFEEGLVTEEILLNPTRIAVYDMSILDTLDYIGIDKLGIIDLGLAKGSLFGHLDKYNNREYKNVGTLFDLDEEELIKFNPQVVFIGGRSNRNYERIKEILPHSGVVGFPLPENDFFNTVNNNLKTLKKIFAEQSDIFETLQNDIKTKLAKVQANVPSLQKALFINVSARNFSVFGDEGRFSVVHDKLYGFGYLPALTEQDIVDKSHGEIINPEYILSVNPDILFVLDRDTAIGEVSTLDEALRSLNKDVTAIANNMVLKVDPFAWYITPGGARSVMQMIADVEELQSR